MDKEFEALDWLNDTLGYFLKKTIDTHCQITLTRNQATEFVDEHKKVEQALTELKAIKEANPSEAMECLEELKNFRYGKYKILVCQTEMYDTIKQALLKTQEQDKVLEIIKEKGVDVGYLKTCKTLEEYNSNCWNDEEDFNKKLTEEEFDLVKRWSEKCH